MPLPPAATTVFEIFLSPMCRVCIWVRFCGALPKINGVESLEYCLGAPTTKNVCTEQRRGGRCGQSWINWTGKDEVNGLWMDFLVGIRNWLLDYGTEYFEKPLIIIGNLLLQTFTIDSRVPANFSVSRTNSYKLRTINTVKTRGLFLGSKFELVNYYILQNVVVRSFPCFI